MADGAAALQQRAVDARLRLELHAMVETTQELGTVNIAEVRDLEQFPQKASYRATVACGVRDEDLRILHAHMMGDGCNGHSKVLLGMSWFMFGAGLGILD